RRKMHQENRRPDAMLERARFQNYRCLRDVTIQFGPLTVLVGPNGSGKSSVLKGLLAVPMGAGDVWQHRTDVVTVVELSLDHGRTLAKEFRSGSSPTLPGSMYSAQFLHLDLNALREPNQANEEPQLASDGRNLANAFATLSRAEQENLARSF